MEKSRPSWAAIAGPVTQVHEFQEIHSKKNVDPNSSDQKALENLGEACSNLDAVHKQAIAVSTEGVEALQTEKLVLESRLNEALRNLVILQPRQDTSDEQIKQLYEELCQNLEDCADSDSTDVVNLSEKTASVDWSFWEATTVFRHFTQDDAELSKLFPEINSNILMSMVFSWLFEMCLNEDKWCCAGSQQEEALLSTVLEAIAQQNPAGGAVLSNRWRAETYLALSNLPDRMETQKDIIWKSNGLICRILNKLTYRPLNYANFREKILNKAFRLAQLMKGSVTRYRFNFPPVSATSDVLLKQDQAKSHRILDAHTGVGIDVETLKDHGETIGKLRLCVFPALSKVQDDGSVVSMVKAVVVLERQKQLDVNEKQKESDGKWEGTCAKLAGTINW